MSYPFIIFSPFPPSHIASSRDSSLALEYCFPTLLPSFSLLLVDAFGVDEADILGDRYSMVTLIVADYLGFITS